jgi:hypothetical protein
MKNKNLTTNPDTIQKRISPESIIKNNPTNNTNPTQKPS